MRFQVVTALLALAGVVSAQGPQMHVVTVGKGGKLAFCPSTVIAAVGDMIQFQFYPKVPLPKTILTSRIIP